MPQCPSGGSAETGRVTERQRNRHHDKCIGSNTGCEFCHRGIVGKTAICVYWNTERVRFFVCSVYLQKKFFFIIISENTLNCFIGHSASLACKDEQIFIWSNSLLIFQSVQAKLDRFLRWLLWGVECDMLWTKATVCTCTPLASKDVRLFIQRAPLPMVFVVLCHLLWLSDLTSVQTGRFLSQHF